MADHHHQHNEVKEMPKEMPKLPRKDKKKKKKNRNGRRFGRTNEVPFNFRIPKTSFSCKGRAPGYYADVEAECKVKLSQY